MRWYSRLVNPLSRDLHPKRAHLPERLHDVLRILTRTVDLDDVDLSPEELLHPLVERRELRPLLGLQRIRIDQVEAEVSEE